MKTKILSALVLLALSFRGIAGIPTVFDRENTAEAYPAITPGEFEQLPEIPYLPDPFMFADGTKSTDYSDWERHRSEILQQLWHFELGEKPRVNPDSIDASLAGDTLTVTIHERGKSLTLQSQIIYPEGDGPFPVVIGVGFPTGSLPKELFIENGVAAMAFDFMKVMSHTQKRGEEPINALYPDNIDMGAYSAWPWGISRLIDGLVKIGEEKTNLNLKRIAVTGCSFAGKMAI